MNFIPKESSKPDKKPADKSINSNLDKFLAPKRTTTQTPEEIASDKFRQDLQKTLLEAISRASLETENPERTKPREQAFQDEFVASFEGSLINAVSRV